MSQLCLFFSPQPTQAKPQPATTETHMADLLAALKSASQREALNPNDPRCLADAERCLCDVLDVLDTGYTLAPVRSN